MPDPRVQRVVVLGTGTGIGKTHLTRALARALRARGAPTVALKPVETGEPWADAQALALDNPFHVAPHPLYAFRDAVSPHLAARREARPISLETTVEWVTRQEAALATYDTMWPYTRWCLVETAGAVFSPLGPGARSFELARALEPSRVVLVAPDALGVLSSLDAALTAMRQQGREPDFVVLSAGHPDGSTGTNAGELELLGVVRPALVLGPGDDDAGPLAETLLAGP